MGTVTCCNGKEINQKLDLSQLTITEPIVLKIQNFMIVHPKINQVVKNKGFALRQNLIPHTKMLNSFIVVQKPQGTFITQNKKSPDHQNRTASGNQEGSSNSQDNNQNNIKPEFGIMLYKKDCYYEGQWKNDKKNGKGLFVCQDGTYYQGEWRDDLAQGNGQYETANPKYKYTGQWINGLKDGKGIQQLEDGSVYKGQFKKDLKSGEGKLMYLNGTVYEGEFSNNIIQGHGKYEGKSQNYLGTWKNGKMHGTGKSQWKNEKGQIIAKYVGQYVNGIKQGFGQYTDSKGVVYKAIWVNGQINQKGPIATQKPKQVWQNFK